MTVKRSAVAEIGKVFFVRGCLSSFEKPLTRDVKDLPNSAACIYRAIYNRISNAVDYIDAMTYDTMFYPAI